MKENPELVEEFFRRDLNRAERETLMAQVSHDERASARLLELAERDYAMTGLPEPLPPAPSGWRVLGLVGGIGFLMGAAAGLWLVGGGKAELKAAPAVAQVTVAQDKPQSEPKESRPEPPRVAGDQFKVLVIQDHGKPAFKLEVSQAASGPVVLWSENNQQRELIHQGWLEQGHRGFVWAPSRAGDYKLTLQTRQGRQVQWVWAVGR